MQNLNEGQQQPVSDRERWSAELAIKRRELDLKETELKQFWRSPLLLTVAGAIVVAYGHFYVAKATGHDQMILEQRKAEYSRILGALSTSNVEQAAANLKFLIDVGLVLDPTVIERVRSFYATSEPKEWPGSITVPTQFS